MRGKGVLFNISAARTLKKSSATDVFHWGSAEQLWSVWHWKPGAQRRCFSRGNRAPCSAPGRPPLQPPQLPTCVWDSFFSRTHTQNAAQGKLLPPAQRAALRAPRGGSVSAVGGSRGPPCPAPFRSVPQAAASAAGTAPLRRRTLRPPVGASRPDGIAAGPSGQPSWAGALRVPRNGSGFRQESLSAEWGRSAGRVPTEKSVTAISSVLFGPERKAQWNNSCSWQRKGVRESAGELLFCLSFSAGALAAVAVAIPAALPPSPGSYRGGQLDSLNLFSHRCAAQVRMAAGFPGAAGRCGMQPVLRCSLHSAGAVRWHAASLCLWFVMTHSGGLVRCTAFGVA